MVDSESESRFDEMEQNSLQKAVADLERAIASAGTGSRQMLESFVQNAKGRIGMLEKKIKDSKAEKESRAREELATARIAELAERETALNAKEKQSFSEFLGKDFFTKKDFAKLEDFYKNTWDRLSDRGKDEMSHRVWEGVRKNEYAFGDLPPAVRERETDRAYRRLVDRAESKVRDPIPSADRDDFTRAYESGDREKASKILERPSFKNGMFLGSESKERMHTGVESGHGQEAKASVAALLAKGGVEKSDVPQAGNKAAEDLSSLSLDGVQLADVAGPPTSADLPNAKTRSASPPQSTRGS